MRKNAHPVETYSDLVVSFKWRLSTFKLPSDSLLFFCSLKFQISSLENLNYGVNCFAALKVPQNFFFTKFAEWKDAAVRDAPFPPPPPPNNNFRKT